MTDVMVAGGGPTGLAMACGLLGAGVSVRVLDKASGPAQTSRALGLQPRGAEVLERLGALGDLPERSVGIQRVSVQINGRHTADLRVGQRTTLVTRPGLLISQAEIEEQLRRRLRELGGEVEWATEVVGAEQDSDGVSVGLGDGTTVRAGWLVGCDGAHSRVRKAAGIGFPGVPLVERFLLADVHADLPVPHGTVSVWLRGEDMIAAFPLPGADLWRLMAPAPDGATRHSATPDNTTPDNTRPDNTAPDETDDVLAVMIHLLTEHTEVPASAVRGVEWTSSFRFHRRLADTYRQGRMLLAGDAAHIHSPFGGQGLNTGLGDAENLAWKLALVCTGRAAPPLLDTYQAERRPIAAEVLASTSGMTRLVLGDTPLARLVRDHVFVPLMNRPWVQRLIWEQASQLKIHYRKGPLAQRIHDPLHTGPCAGDRVPDLACRHPDGTNTRLHAELGARWVLLSRTDNPAVDDCARVVRKHLGEDATTVLVPARRCAMGDVLLVRPDAHLGWRGTPAADRLDRWLSSILSAAE